MQLADFFAIDFDGAGQSHAVVSDDSFARFQRGLGASAHAQIINGGLDISVGNDRLVFGDHHGGGFGQRDRGLHIEADDQL